MGRKEKWVIVTVYNGGEWGELEKKLEEVVGRSEDIEESMVIVGGDFNIRIGELDNDNEGEEVRRSKDKIIGNNGKRFIWWIQEGGWYLLNGRMKGDRIGEFTYVGARGSTVIDYVFVNERALEKIIDFKVESRVDSDHMPLQVRTRKREENIKKEEWKGEEKEGEEKRRVKEKISWSEEAIKKYKERTEVMEQEEGQERWSLEERWQWIKNIARGAMVRVKVKIKRRKIGFKDWWDRECTKGKRRLQRLYKYWRRGKLILAKVMEEKRRYKNLLEEKQRKKREEEEEELKNIKKEVDVWKFINKKRGRDGQIEGEIEPGRWRAHFKNLLDGVEPEEGEMKQGRNVEINEEEDDNIQEEEIREVVKKMKKKKAAGVDGIPMEAWKFAGRDLWNGLVRLMKQVWKEGEIPEDWRKGIVVPIYKKGDPNLPSNYRGVSLLCTAYKVYVELIRRRLEKEVNQKEGLPESQMGFRKGRSTVDNVFILNHLVQRGKKEGEKRKKMYAFFADLKAAFDNVEREVLWEILKKMKIRESLIGRMKKIYERTEVLVRTREGMTERFETKKGVRQGCVLSPLLFNVYIADVDTEFKNRRIGGIELGKERIWNLAYADDIVLMAKSKEAIEDMMVTFGNFLKKRRLELSVEKSKVLVFNRGRNERKETWKWKGREIEEVQNFKYLGFRKGEGCLKKFGG